MLWYELTRSWAYRRIRHPSMVWYIWYVPGTIAVVLAVVYVSIPEKSAFTSESGLISGVSQIMALLPGFFIAALAAVATFDRPEMDEEMPSPTPTVLIYRGGEWIEVPLSRRLFLTYLFSYLTTASFLVFGLCIATKIFSPAGIAASKLLPEYLKGLGFTISEFAIVIIILYWSLSILISTLHGIYFLAERMHQPH